MSALPDTGFRVEPADYAADFKDLRAVREPVFVVEQNVPLEMEWDELDPMCRHVIARDDQHQPIGTGRLTPEHKIGRMAVLKEWRGRGVGEALLLALIEQARDLGLPQVSLHAQVDAIGFYEKFGFESYGERFEEAGIQHQSMRLALAPKGIERREGPRPRGPSQPATDFEGLDAVRERVLELIRGARRDIVVYSRDLEPAIYAHPAIVQAFKEFAISGRGGVARFVVQDPALARRSPHPLLALAQRLSTAFEIRTPTDPE
jgi:predicted GNAT family N-acyltransferase